MEYWFNIMHAYNVRTLRAAALGTNLGGRQTAVKTWEETHTVEGQTGEIEAMLLNNKVIIIINLLINNII